MLRFSENGGVGEIDGSGRFVTPAGFAMFPRRRSIPAEVRVLLCNRSFQPPRSGGADVPDSAIIGQGRWFNNDMVARYIWGESLGDAARWLE